MTGAAMAASVSIPHTCVVLGVGLRALAQPAALQALWRQAQDHLPESIEPTGFCAVAVLDRKADHAALAQWLQAQPGDAPVLPVAAEALPAQAVHTQSPRLQARYGTGSVAEAAALSAAGPRAELLLPRLVAEDGSATLAVALRRPAPGQADCCFAAAGPGLATALTQE